MAAVHALLWAGGFGVALLLRFDGMVPSYARTGCVRLLTVLLLARLASFHAVRLFGGLFRYEGLPELRRIVAATAAASIVALGARSALAPVVTPTLLLGELLASVVAVGGLRMMVRGVYEGRRRSREAPARMLVIGANDTGESLLRELSRGKAYEVVGFLDEDPAQVGSDLHDVPVMGVADGPTLERVVVSSRIDQVVFAFDGVATPALRDLVVRARRLGVRTLIVPSLEERMAAPREPVRDIALEDLLGREPVRLDEQQLAAFLQGKSVLVTGAGGSIGSELARQVLRVGPRELLLFDHDENALFFIDRELRELLPGGSKIRAIIGDLTDPRAVSAVFDRFAPQVVLHAAAHKHVGMMEQNACEAARNNVFGTRILAQAAHRAGAEAFVLISTDKAVNPTSVMGATKRVCEMVIQRFACRSQTRFAAVRFGNVLGSNGSVVPLFTEQIARGGPVTVRHPDVERYFMTIPEAAGLVLQAGALGSTGQIFLLDMGEPVRIADLARLLIEMHGLRAGVDIPIEYSGLLPGEKLHEELLLDSEARDEVRPHPKIMVGRIALRRDRDLLEGLEALRVAIESGDDGSVRAVLSHLVPEARLASAAGPVRTSGAEAASEVAVLEAWKRRVDVGARAAHGGRE